MMRERPDYQEWHRDLAMAQDTIVFAAKVDAFAERYGDYVLTDPGSPFRDAHCAAVFANLCGAKQVRLIDANQPDFEVECDGQWQAYEVTEADMPGRHRDAEIKAERQAAAHARMLSSDEWLNPDCAKRILANASEKKARKDYDPQFGLLIYLNPGEFGIYQQEIERLMPDATAVAGSYFREVWVLWKGVAYNPWYKGRTSAVVRRPD